MPTLPELIERAPWHEAVTWRETWPHEYAFVSRDNQRPLMDVICKRLTNGEGVDGRFYGRSSTYLFIGEYKYGSSHECMQGEQVLSAFKLCRISHLRESAMTRYLRRGCGGLDRRLHLRARGTRPPAFEAVEGSSGRAMAIGASQPRVSPGCMIVTA